MKAHWFIFISTLLLFVIFHSVNASQADSLQNLVKHRLANAAFEQEEDVIEYVDLTIKIYSKSPADALFYLNALEEKLQLENKTTAWAYILKTKGTFYWSQGIYDAALKAFFEALKLYEQNDDSLGVIKSLNNIGETYKKQKDYSQSAIFIKLALSKAKAYDEKSPQLILVNLGQLFLLQENFDSASFYLNQIIQKEDASIQSKAFAALYKGMIDHATDQIDSAHYYLQQSLQFWNEISYNRGIVESNIEIAATYISEHKLNKANQHLNEAEVLALKINSLDLLLKIYQAKIDIIKTSGSKDSLVYYFNKYIHIKDSIFNSESRAEINKLSIEYNVAQKEKESYKLALDQEKLARTIEQRTQFLVLLTIILILTIAMIIYLRSKSNQLKTAHIKLKQQKEDIEQKQKKITSNSLELAKVNNELYDLNTNLEKRIIEGTNKLNERNKQIAEFTFYNSHRLRAPVAHVLGLINIMELSKDGKIDPQIIEYLKISGTELDKVIYNLKNLLELEDEDDSIT